MNTRLSHCLLYAVYNSKARGCYVRRDFCLNFNEHKESARKRLISIAAARRGGQSPTKPSTREEKPAKKSVGQQCFSDSHANEKASGCRKHPRILFSRTFYSLSLARAPSRAYTALIPCVCIHALSSQSFEPRLSVSDLLSHLHSFSCTLERVH